MGLRQPTTISGTGSAPWQLGIRRLKQLLSAVALVLVVPSAGADDGARSGWVEIRTANFTLYTDAGAETGTAISRRLERFRGVFARLAPSLELRSPAPTTLFAFRDADSYGPFKSREDRPGARTLGQFSRTRDGNYLTLDASAVDAGAIGVIYHEYVHFLVLNNFPKVPLWFNEGLAEYYSTFELDGTQATLGLPVERHVRRLRQETDLSLDELLTVDSEAAAEHKAEEVGRFYGLSWLLVHYLLSGGDEEIDGIVDYFDRLGDGESPDRAFDRAFGRAMSTMAAELRTYLASDVFPSRAVRLGRAGGDAPRVRPLASAEVMFQLGDLSLHLGKTAQAERLFHRALERDGRHGDALAGLAHLRDLGQRLDEAGVLHADADAAGPRRLISFMHRARHSLTLAQGGGENAEHHAEAARRALRSAVGRMPSFAEALALQGWAEALPGGDFKRALRSIREARQLVPSRQDWLARHIQILLQGEKIDEAEVMLRDQLQPVSEDYELVTNLWQAVDRAYLLRRSKAAFEAGDYEVGLQAFDEMVSLATDPALRARLEAQLEDLKRQVEAQENGSGAGSRP